MKIYIEGRDNLGWHLDVERENISRSINRLNLSKTKNPFVASVIHNIFWNRLNEPHRRLFFRNKKKILATTSNFVDLDNPYYENRKKFEEVNSIVSAWIVPSRKQKNIMDRHNIRSFYQPFYLNHEIFKPLSVKTEKLELAEKFNIPHEILEGKIVIGSFQRDSLGSDLSKPKWQKGPELLIDLLKDLPKDNFVLLLAGPRRHYVIKECKRHDIEYFYVGKETDEDDIKINSLSIESMPDLYQLTDIYVVTSKSEGGPKAVMEATATKSFILSTDVGLAADFLEYSNVFSDQEKYKKVLYELVTQPESFRQRQQDIETQYNRCIDLLNYKAMDQRLLDIYKQVMTLR